MGALVAQAVMVLHIIELMGILNSYLFSLGEGRNKSLRGLLRDGRWQRVRRKARGLSIEHPKLKKAKETVE